ncbi:hypothetical protein [Xanthomonas vasicola]|uniref:hypothetical protein n=1 Tax=Xanthomonas vasicola TaxID=56459 RepID=UPI0021BD144C|nr:hypothetical protein [Xanthomonas vasicola]
MRLPLYSASPKVSCIVVVRCVCVIVAGSRGVVQSFLNQRGHGHGGSLGEGEPDGHPERDGSTQPNFGQSGTYGKQQHIEAQQRALDDNTDETENH